MTKTVVWTAIVAVTVSAAALAYHAAAREHDYRALLAKGDLALTDDQTFGAIEAYSGAIALRPDSMLAHLRRGETYQRRGDLESAARDFRDAAALDRTATRPLEELGDVQYQLVRYTRAVDAYAAALRLDDRSAALTYKLALARYRTGDLDEALSAIAQALKLNDRMADAYYLRGLCLRDRRRTREAEAALQRAVAIAPGAIPAREELADLYAASGRHNEELEQLQALASLDRDRPERQVALGLAHNRAGHEELAVVTLSNALERAPDQPQLYAALGHVWLDRAQAHNDRVFLNKAVEALERVSTSPGASSALLTLYGRALLQSGRTDAAEAVLKDATTRFPVDPQAFLLYATAAERVDRVADAREALIKVGTLLTDDAALAARAGRIGLLSARLNDFEGAVTWLRRALTATPGDMHLLTALADAQLRTGDIEGAKATIAHAYELDPTNPAVVALNRRIRR